MLVSIEEYPQTMWMYSALATFTVVALYLVIDRRQRRMRGRNAMTSARLAKRRRAGIPDSDTRPWLIACPEAELRRREAATRKAAEETANIERKRLETKKDEMKKWGQDLIRTAHRMQTAPQTIHLNMRDRARRADRRRDHDPFLGVDSASASGRASPPPERPPPSLPPFFAPLHNAADAPPRITSRIPKRTLSFQQPLGVFSFRAPALLAQPASQPLFTQAHKRKRAHPGGADDAERVKLRAKRKTLLPPPPAEDIVMPIPPAVPNTDVLHVKLAPGVDRHKRKRRDSDHPTKRIRKGGDHVSHSAKDATASATAPDIDTCHEQTPKDAHLASSPSQASTAFRIATNVLTPDISKPAARAQCRYYLSSAEFDRQLEIETRSSPRSRVSQPTRPVAIRLPPSHFRKYLSKHAQSRRYDRLVSKLEVVTESAEEGDQANGHCSVPCSHCVVSNSAMSAPGPEVSSKVVPGPSFVQATSSVFSTNPFSFAPSTAASRPLTSALLSPSKRSAKKKQVSFADDVLSKPLPEEPQADSAAADVLPKGWGFGVRTTGQGSSSGNDIPSAPTPFSAPASFAPTSFQAPTLFMAPTPLTAPAPFTAPTAFTAPTPFSATASFAAPTSLSAPTPFFSSVSFSTPTSFSEPTPSSTGLPSGPAYHNASSSTIQATWTTSSTGPAFPTRPPTTFTAAPSVFSTSLNAPSPIAPPAQPSQAFSTRGPFSQPSQLGNDKPFAFKDQHVTYSQHPPSTQSFRNDAVPRQPLGPVNPFWGNANLSQPAPASPPSHEFGAHSVYDTNMTSSDAEQMEISPVQEDFGEFGEHPLDGYGYSYSQSFGDLGDVPSGFPPRVLSPEAFDPEGSPYGLPQDGFAPDDFPPDGFAPDGFAPDGFPPDETGLQEFPGDTFASSSPPQWARGRSGRRGVFGQNETETFRGVSHEDGPSSRFGSGSAFTTSPYGLSQMASSFGYTRPPHAGRALSTSAPLSQAFGPRAAFTSSAQPQAFGSRGVLGAPSSKGGVSTVPVDAWRRSASNVFAPSLLKPGAGPPRANQSAFSYAPAGFVSRNPFAPRSPASEVFASQSAIGSSSQPATTATQRRGYGNGIYPSVFKSVPIW